MRRVLVTGGAGFVGRHAVAALARRGFEIHALGRRAPDGAHAFHAADLHDANACRAAVRAAGASRLLHLAWVTEPGRYWQSPENLAWTAASLDLVRAFREAGGIRAVVAGTCAEYDWTGVKPLDIIGFKASPPSPRPKSGSPDFGPSLQIPAKPALSPQAGRGDARRPRDQSASTRGGRFPESALCRPATLYGAAKDGLRRILTAYAATSGLSLAWGRLFYLYGPGEAPGRLVGDAARALLAQERLATSEGRQRRDFLHVADAGRAFAALLESGVEGPVNIGSGTAVPVRTILERIGLLTGGTGLIDFGARPLGPEPACIEADIGRLTAEVGFRPAISLEEGLRATVEGWRARL